MKAREIRNHLLSLDRGWVDRDTTLDTFKAGDPDTEVTGIAVGWMSYTWAIRKALEHGCNLFVTHEPTFFSHKDDDESVFRYAEAQGKRELIERSGIVVLRCHDLWDKLPEIGVADCWARQLGLSRPIAGDGYYRLFDVTGQTSLSVAQQIARSVKSLGQESVQLLGPSDKPVSRLAIGTGAATPLTHLIDRYGADIIVCSDDGFTYWRDGALSIDMGVPVVVVNHAVSELAGILSMAEHLRSAFPAVTVHHIEQSCMYSLVYDPAANEMIEKESP